MIANRINEPGTLLQDNEQPLFWAAPTLLQKKTLNTLHHPFKESTMIIVDWIHAVAGFFILISLALGFDSAANPLFVSRYWLLLTAFVGANLLQFGFTKFCPLATILKKLGVPESR